METLLIPVLIAALTLASPPPPPKAADTDKCTVDIQTCVNNWSKVRTSPWIGLDYDKSEPGVLKVKAVIPNSPAATAGFEPGDVITAVNGANLNDKEAVKKARGEWTIGQVVLYTIRRGVDEKQLGVTLGVMTDEVFYATVGQHVLVNHVVEKAASSVKK